MSALTARIWSGQNAETNEIEIEGNKINYKFQQPKQSGAPVVIFLPGLFAGSWMWASTCAKLANFGYGFVAIDPPYAHVSPPLLNPLTIFDFLIDQIRDKFNSSPITLAGNSLGGLAAVDYVIRKEISIQIIASGIPGLGPVDLPGLPIHRRPTQADAKIVANGIFYDQNAVSQDMIVEALECFQKRKYLFNLLKYLISVKTYPLVEKLNKYKGELNLIWGEKDKITPLEIWKDKFTKQLTSGKFKLLEIPNSGHSPMIEQPDKFNEFFISMIDNNGLK